MHRTLAVFACVVLTGILPGCLSTTTAGSRGETAGTSTPEAASNPTLLVDRDFKLAPGAFEGDVLCASGGAFELSRIDGALATNGTNALEFWIQSPPGNSGIQLGYAFKDGPRTWLPTVFNGEAKFSVPIGAGQHELERALWHFYYSQNVPSAERSCYTGVSLASHVRVTATPTPVSI